MQTVSRAAIIIEVLNIEATATIIKDNKFSQKQQLQCRIFVLDLLHLTDLLALVQSSIMLPGRRHRYQTFTVSPARISPTPTQLAS